MEPTKNLSDFSSSNTQSSGGSTGLSLANFLDEPKANTGPVDLAGAIAQEGAEHIKPLIEAFYKQESGSGKNAGTSVDGAKGGMQVIPATFSRYAKPGESIDNPADNVRVGVRILKDLASKFGNDPAKIATGYFSGDGNVNQGSGQAWKEDRADGNGMRVSKYVSGILDKLGVTPKAQASAAPDITKAPKWSDIEGKPEFKALNDEQKAAAKQSYFDYWIAPHAGTKGDELRKQFMQPKESEHGLLGGVLAAAKSGVGSVIDALTPDTQSLESPYKGERPANPDATLVPVSKETRAGFNSTWDAATPEQRKAMAEQPGWVGQLARERNSMYAQPGTQIGKRFDTRVESRRDTLIANGEDARFADTAARMGAQRGVVPGQEVASMATAKESGFDFDTKQAFQSGQPNGLNNPLVRGLAKGGLGFSKAITGYGEFLADTYGLDEAKKIVQSGSQWARGKEQAIGEAGTTLDRNFEGAISSIAQQLPLIVGGIRAGSEAVPLAGMALQSFGQEYSDGRASGQDVAQATTRAAIFSAFEVIGEKFGLRASMQAIKGAAHGMASDKLLGFLGEALKKEIPGELLTTTGQFTTDKFAPGGVGLNPNATLDDYLQQVADTVIQTVMQGGVMAGGTTGVSAAVRHLQDNGQTQASAAADANLAQQQAMSKWATTGLGQSTSDPAGRFDPVGVPDSVHPSVTDAEQIVRELAADAGIPEETVLPTKVTPQPAPVVQDIAPMSADTGAETEAVSDQDVLNLANSRYQQLREKRDGAMALDPNSETGDQTVPGAGLSPREAQEMGDLERANQDVGALRAMYGLNNQAQQSESQPVSQQVEQATQPPQTEVTTNGTEAAQAEPSQSANQEAADQGNLATPEAGNEPSVSATGSTSLEADGLTNTKFQANATLSEIGKRAIAGEITQDEAKREYRERVGAMLTENANKLVEKAFSDATPKMLDDARLAIKHGGAEGAASAVFGEAGIQSGLYPQQNEAIQAEVLKRLMPQAPAKPKTEKEAKQRKAIDRIAKGSAYFGSQEKATGWIADNGLAETHEAKKTGASRWDVVAKQSDAQPNVAQQGDPSQALPIPQDAFAKLLEQADIFSAPDKTVMLDVKLKNEPYITKAEADEKLSQWRAHAKEQAKSGVNNGKVVLSLFDASGQWSAPWREAGYDVYQFDIQHGDDINDFSVEFLTEKLGIDHADVILAAPPCTDFSSSGAHAWPAKDADGRTAASVELVRQVLRTVEFFKPSSWVLENPVGRIKEKAGLPKPTLTFQPNNFGDQYTKRTLLWGSFGTDLPTANVEPEQGSKIAKLSGSDKYGRSLTPEGFAYAYFMGNNLADMGAAARLAKEFRGIPVKAFQDALDSGMSEYDAKTAVEDAFYDGDIEGAIEALGQVDDQQGTDSSGGSQGEQAGGSRPTPAASEKFANNKIFTADKVAAARARMKAKLGQMNSGLDPELMIDGATLAGAYIEDGVRKYSDYTKAMVEDFGEKIRPYLRSFYEAVRHFPGLDTAGMTTAAEIDLMEQQGTAAHIKAAPGTEKAVGQNVKAQKATKERKAQSGRKLRDDWGVSYIDGYTGNQEFQGEETDYGLSGGVKDAFLKDAQAYLREVAKSLEQAGYVVPVDRSGKQIKKPVSVNESGPAVSGDVSMVMFHPHAKRGVYIHIGSTTLRGMVNTTKSGVAMMMRLTKEGDPYGGSENLWLPVDQTSDDLVNFITREVEKNSTSAVAIESTLAPVQNAVETKEADHAIPVQPKPVSEGTAGNPEPAAAAGNRDSKPVGTGLATGGEGSDRKQRVPTGVARTGEAGTGGVEPVSSDAPGQARDRAGERIESESTGSNESSDDHVIDASEIGKGGLGKKFKENIAAIKLLKSLEADGRVATADERKALAKYVGWGAMKGPFDPENKAWAKQHAELKELLTDAEFKAARASTLDAHYTSPVAIGAIYDALTRIGFTGGRLLEPSVGSGNFFGLMPKGMRQASQLHGVELDSLTSRLVAALYPKAKIAKATGFEDFDVPSEFFDAVVGNPPFGNTPVVDKERSAYSGFSVHNYFLAKGIDKLRPGGVMAVVVSHNFLDAQDGRARKWIGERANLVAAARLPNTAFKENAGTEVVTDILIFQKKGEGVNSQDAAPWQSVVEQKNLNPKTGEQVAHKVNQLFASNPGFVLGTPSAAGSMYSSNEYTIEANGDLGKQLEKWASNLPGSLYTSIARKADTKALDMAIPDGIKVGSFYIAPTGRVMRRGADLLGDKTAFEWTPKSESQVARMKGMIELRDALRTQMRLERSPDATEAEIEANRGQLNKLYDDFVKKFKHVNSSTNRSIFLDDTEAHLIQGLEFDYDKGIGEAAAAKDGIDVRPPSAKKADIFERRVAFPPQDFMTVQTAKDALLASLNYRGKVDAEYIAGVYSKPFDEVVKELGDVVFDDPTTGVVTADEYLSGDVKTKLDEAKEAAKADSKYRRNVAALEAVIPKDKLPSEISVSIGASFVPGELYEEFVKHISGGTATAAYVKAMGQWLLAYTGGTDPALNTGRFGTSELSAQDLFQLTMLGRGAVVKKTYKNPDGSTTTVTLEKETEAAREKQNAIKAEWQKWIWQDTARADRLATIYNEKMNRLVVRKFDGSHLTFPGMNPAINLLAHQKNGVWRGLQSYQVLYDHVVGAGKTFEMATLAMEMRRLGIARKPLFVVPNHLTLQWRSEFTRLYPGANILAATPDDFSKNNRERMFAKIITGDWDAVVIGHSSLKKIGLPEKTEIGVMEEQIEELAAAIEEMKRSRGDKRITADMERIRKTLEAKMKEKLTAIGTRSKMVTFDELGVDAMFVDEMHEFKNLTYHTTMDRNPGMGNPAGSAKAFDMFVKTRWLFDTFGEKTPFITATGTPVSNSLVEMFNMQRYMQYPLLKREGLNVFDAWAKQFGNVENVYEVAPSGSGYRQSTRFAKFTNLPGLMSLYNSFADTITLDDLKAQEEEQGKRFPVPKIQGGRPTLIVAKRSPAVAELMGVPKAETDEHGNITFEIPVNEAMETEIKRAEKGDKFIASVKVKGADGAIRDVHLGQFDTEQDARLKIVEKALTPVVTVNPESILGRFANLRELTKQSKGKVNALSLTGEANKAGLDYRLVNPSAPDFEGSKINLAVGRMMEIYKKWAKDLGTQLVFCDLSIPLSARASYSSDSRKLYVRDDVGAVVLKRGTMHTVEGHEDLPFFVLTRGEKELRRFDVYDAATGLRLLSDYRAKADAVAAAGEAISDDAKREKLISARESGREISQAEVDDYNNENDIEVEDAGAFFTREDIAGMSGSAKFSVYDDIKAKLMAKGVPEREIAFIHDYSSPTAKEKLFKAVKAGEVRFLLGSTPKMGAGTNVQDRLVGLHHIDAPWRPSDLEQREGRIIRRGNKLYERDPDNFEVFIGRYATEQTYDTRRWQILEHKARGIEQLRNYDGSTNEIDDIDGEAANSADMKAAASGDPMILEETKLRNDVRRLEQLQSSHADEVLAMARKATYADEYVKKWGPKEIAEISELIASTNGHPLDKDGFAPISVEGRNRSTTKEAAQKDLASAFESVRSNMRQSVDIVYRGITFRMELFAGGQVILNTPTGNIGSWPITDSFSASGALQRLKNYVDRLPGLIDNANTKVEKAKIDSKALREQAGKPFANAEQLEKAREDHKKVQRALMAKGPAVPDSQKPMLKKGLESQKVALKKAGFGEALDEFFGSGNEIKFNTQDGQDEYNRPHEEAEVHTQQRTERTARNMRSFQAGVLRDLSRNGHHLRDDVTYFVPVAVPQAREISEIARAFGTEIQWFELNEGLTANERRHLGKYIGANLGGIQYIKASGVDRPHLAVLGHELAHELKKKHPDLYNQFVEAVNAFIKPGAYPKFLNEGVAKNSSDPREEFSGEVLSDLFMERKFWQSMGERSPTLLQKIADLVLALAEKLMQTVGYTKRSAPYLSDFQKVMDIAEDVMRQFASRVEKATQNDEIRFATTNSTGKLMEFARKAQNNLIHFFGNQNLDTFNWYDKSIATQYHKALKDPHFGKVYQLLLGMQNHVSMAAVRAAQMAPGVLPRVDDAKTAVKELFSVKSREALDKASMAIFSGTLAGDSVLEGVVWSPAQLRANFQMDEAAIALYYQARAAIDSSLDEVAAAEAYSMAHKIVPKSLRADIIERPEDASKLISDEINAQIKTMGVAIAAAKKAGDNQMQAELSATRDSYKSTLRQIEAIFTKALNLKNAGYAPLVRFGKYTVEVQPVDPQTGLVERDEDGKPMTIYFGRFETQADARRVQADMDEHYKNRDDIRVSAGSYNDSKHEIYSGVTPETLELFADAIGAGTAADEYIRLVKSDRSALKRQLERKGTPGFSTDVSRVLSNFITSNARHAAQQFYMQAINNAVKYIPKEKGDVQKEAQKLRNFVIDPKDAGAIGSSLMFAWFLGGSPAAAAVNATQPLMVTLPYLSQFVSPEKAAAELTKATPAAMGKAEIADADLRDALRRASLEGAVDAQEIFHLYSLGSRQLALGTKSQAALTLWGSMFSAVEGLNRRLTFIAAWNIAKQQGNKSPYAFAIRAVNSTQGIYNKVNRPNFARSSVGRLVFTYKGYAFMVMELMTRMWKSGPNGKRGVAIMLAMLLLASGEEGLPGAKALDDLIDSIGQLMGYDTNMRRFKRRHAYEILGKAFGDAFLYGASSHMPLDFGGRLGLGSMIPGTDLLKISSANQKGKAIGEIVGPSAGMAQQVGDAIEAAGEGNFGQAMQNLAPKAVKDVLAAASMATKGYSTDAVGRKVVDVGLSDAAVKAVGFQPTVIAQEHRKTMPIQQDIALQQKTEASIVANWAQGIVNKDENMVDQARAKMEKWNKDNPDSAIAISPSQIKSRVKMLVSDKENRTLHKAPKEMRGRVGLDLADD